MGTDTGTTRRSMCGGGRARVATCWTGCYGNEGDGRMRWLRRSHVGMELGLVRCGELEGSHLSCELGGDGVLIA